MILLIRTPLGPPTELPQSQLNLCCAKDYGAEERKCMLASKPRNATKYPGMVGILHFPYCVLRLNLFSGILNCMVGRVLEHRVGEGKELI